MSTIQAFSLARGQKASHEQSLLSSIDIPLLLAVIALLSIGLVMVGSASIALADKQSGQPFYYLYRQMVYIGLGVSLAIPMLHLRLDYLEKAGPVLLMIGFALLLLVLVPGVGRTVNGSTRWLPMGVFNFQVSELAKLFVLVYLAGYLVRRNDEIRSNVWGFLKPILVLVLACLLMLLEPDFGSAVVLISVALGMMYLAGVRFWQFFVLLVLAAVTLYCLAYFSPYRWAPVVRRTCRGTRDGWQPERHPAVCRDHPSSLRHWCPCRTLGTVLRCLSRLWYWSLVWPAGVYQYGCQHGCVADQGADPAAHQLRPLEPDHHDDLRRAAPAYSP